MALYSRTEPIYLESDGAAGDPLTAAALADALLAGGGVTGAHVTDGAIAARHLAGALKPSGTAAAGDEALRAIGTTASTACAGNDARLSDARTPTDGSVTAAKVAAALKPSGSAAVGDEALRRLGTGSGEAAPGTNAVARVAHGATAGTTRPSGYALVVWIGSVEPTNRSSGDLWVRTA